MIEINNLTSIHIDKAFLKRVAKKVLKGENKKGDISIVLVGSGEIKKLNKKYRRKNAATDVLSFDNILSSKFQVPSSDLGEIILCPSQIKKNTEKFRASFKQELAKVLIHGILHLLGYDHEKTGKEAKLMERKTEYYLSKTYS